MSSQSAATPSKGSSSPIPANSAINQVYDRVRERIARRAYDLYQQDGNQPGHDLRHWLQAESEILTDVPEIRESGSWYTINVPLRGFAANEVRISVEAQRAIVAAEKREVTASEPASAYNVLEQAATASAYLMNGVLTLTVKRA